MSLGEKLLTAVPVLAVFTTSTLVAGKVNSLLYIRNGDVAEVWINGVSQGSQTAGNSLPTDARFPT
jgi:uncharacterized membrane protein